MNKSDKFIKYSSIENHYQEGFLERCPEGQIYWCVTEKIHGSNFQVYYDGENLLIGSRNRFLNATDKFNGLQDIIKELEPNIKACYDELVVKKPLTFYGEIYGDGIQKGVKYCKEHKIKFFDIKYDGNYLPYSIALEALKYYKLPCVEPIQFIQATAKNVVNLVGTRFNSIVAEDEYANLEENICEGVVIKPFYEELQTVNGSRVIIKKKNEEFKEKSHASKSVIKVDRWADYKKDFESLVPYINDNRFDAVFSKEPYKKENFGDFIKAYAEDVVTDAAKDSIEVKNIKNLNNIIAKTFKQEYFRRVA